MALLLVPDSGLVGAICRRPEAIERLVGDNHVLAGVDALTAPVAIPARHVDGGGVALVGDGHGSHAAHHGKTGLWTPRFSHCPFT